ncbi:MAG: alpha/beta fold hydrolase [Nocardiopsaceae bacterium]|nr:alpha/beta fold hydrolase [Nocardiopsaceae bacterium]
MNEPLVTTATLVTTDGVPIDTVHLPGPGSRVPGAESRVPGTESRLPEPGSRLPGPERPRDLAIVMAHGFTQSWQRPMVWRIAKRFNQAAGVVTFDFRGHGRSGGLSTLGDKEVNDLDVAVSYARQLGYRRVATVGFSMGGSVVLRHGGLVGGVDAVVSVSGPGHWFYRGTGAMRKVHLAAEKRVGRLFARHVLGTRISPVRWDPEPMPPAIAAGRISPVPVLIVHGDKDLFFPPDHGRELYDGAREPKELWLLPGFGHAERATDDALADRIAAWTATAVIRGARPEAAAS